VGTDISPACATFLRPTNEFLCCSASQLPFKSGAFSFVFSIYALEHIAEVDAALSEMRRVTKPGGYILLKPAWFCRPWNGREWFHKRPEDCTCWERIQRALVSIRNSLPFRAVHLAQWRLRGLFAGEGLRYRKIQP